MIGRQLLGADSLFPNVTFRDLIQASKLAWQVLLHSKQLCWPFPLINAHKARINISLEMYMYSYDYFLGINSQSCIVG